MSKKEIYKLKNPLNESRLLGTGNKNITLIEEMLGYEIILNHGSIFIDDNIDSKDVINIFENLEKLIASNFNFNIIDIINIIKAIKKGNIDKLLNVLLKKDIIITLSNGKAIYPKTINQSNYFKSLKDNNLIFGIGPAGTGKTYLAVLFAASLLKKNAVKKIILVRPVVEAGEKLGFLPGDLKEKIDPYLIPLYDALNECFSKKNLDKMMETGIIEVAPLAYMRGRTLSDAVIILDEAQNTTKAQMKMFLTRMGDNSKMIVTGDTTQIDLPSHRQSGLINASKILRHIKGISFIEFEKNDVMRNPLVYKIVERYEKND